MSSPKKRRTSRRAASPAKKAPPAADAAAVQAGGVPNDASPLPPGDPAPGANESASESLAAASEPPADDSARQPRAASNDAPAPLVAPAPNPPPASHVDRWRAAAFRVRSNAQAWVGRTSASRWGPLAIASAIAIVAVAIVALLWRPGGAPAPQQARFVGSAACAACHRAEHDAWQRSQHAHAMQPATDATVRARFDGSKFRYAGVESSFFRSAEKFVARTDNAGGRVEDFDVKYTIGVDPLQQYLVELAGGKLQALSIAWDTRPKAGGGERWFHIYPLDKINHRDELHWTRRAQNWNFMCADCHAVDVRKNYDAASDTYRTTWSELGAGCEACHGPGSLHVAWARGDNRDAARGLTVALDERKRARWTIDAATGNATRSIERRADTEIETCAPCHSRRAQIAEGWHAGEQLLDFYRPSLLEPALYFADGQQRDQVFEWGTFVQSLAYRRGVTCGDCHEPHGGALRAQGGALCAQCHLASKYDAPSHRHHADGAGVRCVDCHMPATSFMVVDARRDHGMRVPRPDLTIALGTPNACNACHARKSAQWADDAIRGWFGHRAQGLQRYAAAFAYAERGAAEAGRNLAAIAGDLSQPPFARASAVQALARFPSAQATDAAKRAAGDADPLVRHASIAALASATASERWSVLAPLLRDPLRTLRIDAAAVLADAPGAASDAAFARAAAEYEASLRYAADRPESRVALGTFYARLRRNGDADAAFRSALALDAAYVPAYVAFADAFRMQDRDADAVRVLREGLARAPDDPSLYHALGLALVRMKRASEGLRELARATQLAPADAHLAYVYAVALSAHGRTSAAVREVDRALARHPDDRDLLAGAVTFRRDGGDKAGAARAARRFVERYPEDAQAQRLAAPGTAR